MVGCYESLRFPVHALSKNEVLWKSFLPPSHEPWTPASGCWTLVQTELCSVSQPPSCLSYSTLSFSAAFKPFSCHFSGSRPCSFLEKNLWAWHFRAGSHLRRKVSSNAVLPHIAMLPSLRSCPPQVLLALVVLRCFKEVL